MKELLVLPAVDQDVDGGVDDEGEVVDVDEVQDPVRPGLHLAMDRQLDALVHVYDGPVKLEKIY